MKYKCSWKTLTASSGTQFLEVFTRSVYGAFFYKVYLENLEMENLSNTVRKVDNISIEGVNSILCIHSTVIEQRFPTCT